MSMSCRFLSRLLSASVLAAIAVLSPSRASAEDIDIYAPALNLTQSGNPNLMMLIDTAAVWDSTVSFTCPMVGTVQPVSGANAGTEAGFTQCALYSAVYQMSQSTALAGNINMGLMRYTEMQKDGTANTGLTFAKTGGMMKFPSIIGNQVPPQLLPPIGGSSTQGQTNLSGLLSTIAALDVKNDKASTQQLGTAMQEIWAYFYAHDGTATGQSAALGQSGENYGNLVIANHCRKNFALLILPAFNNTDPGKNNQWPFAYLNNAVSLINPPAALATNLESKINLTGSGLALSGVGSAPEMARFMYQTDLSGGQNQSGNENITTYTIIITNTSGNRANPAYVSYLTQTAAYGGGKAFIVDLADPNALNNMINDLLTIFGEVQEVDSVFSSVSLPLSVNNQGTYQNQFYYGMFRPEANFLPRWWGNLKQYQAGYDNSGNLILTDANNNSALSGSTGFIQSLAVSFWTRATNAVGTAQWPSAGYWLNVYNSTPTTTNPTPSSDSPDGAIVEKGAAAEVQREVNLVNDVRTVYTLCSATGSSSTCNSTTGLDAFSATTLSANTTFGTTAASVPSTTNLVKWIRGQDISPNEREFGPWGQTPTTSTPGVPASLVTTARPSIHGDVLHSQPAVINYGIDPVYGNIGVVVYYGANDGTFRAINGNQTASMTNGATTVPAGGELWAFVAPDFFPQFLRLYNNSPTAQFGVNAPAGSTPRDYFFDGSTAVFIDKRPASTTYNAKYIYLMPRRGGRFIYAFDVSSPFSPKFLWKKGVADMPELGQTWSEPQVALVAGQADPVLIMGGGYDTNEDVDPVVAADTMGRAIFILDAINGNSIWTAQNDCTKNTPTKGTCVSVGNMKYAMPSAPAVLARNNTAGYVDRVYVPDLGGNIWRVDLPPSGNWTVSQLASLGGSGTSARKFFYPPAAVPTSSFDMVEISSGDREHPLNSTVANTAGTVQNAFFAIQDPNTGTSVPGTWTPITIANLSYLYTSGQTPVPYVPTSTSQGFYINFRSQEKGVNAPLVVAGYAYFGTNQAVSSATSQVCTANLGNAFGYAIDFMTGTGLNSQGFVSFNGGGMPPSPVFGFVSITAGGTTQTVGVLIGGGDQSLSTGSDSRSSLGIQKVSPPAFHTRKRTYWYQEGVK